MVAVLTPRAILRAVILEVARERLLVPELIESRSRLRQVEEARAMVARRLLLRGVREERIAAMMHTGLPTVQVYLGRRKRQIREKRHDQGGSEGSTASGDARGAGGGEQAADRYQDQGEGQGGGLDAQHQAGQARRSRAVT
jgi:hypothetical protein